VSGQDSCTLAGRTAHLMIAVEPKPELGEMFDAFIDAGFTEVAIVQIGGDQQELFIRWARDSLLPALRSL
jgi:hypothetical protein